MKRFKCKKHIIITWFLIKAGASTPMVSTTKISPVATTVLSSITTTTTAPTTIATTVAPTKDPLQTENELLRGDENIWFSYTEQKV